MSIWSRFFARPPSPAPARPAADARMLRDARLNMLSLAIRDVVHKHGIPPAWIGAETVPASTGNDTRAVHLRLLARDADPRLLANLPALQQAIQARLSGLDPTAGEWMAGMSWRLDVADGAAGAQLPGPEFWGALSAARPRTDAPASPDARARREEVALALRAGDRAFQRTTSELPPEFSPTQPMFSPTQPMGNV